MEVPEAVKASRSVSKFKPTPIGDDKVVPLANAARMAPSAENLQPWKIVAVTDEDLKRKLSGAITNGKRLPDAPVVLVACARLDAAEALARGRRAGREVPGVRARAPGAREPPHRARPDRRDQGVPPTGRGGDEPPVRPGHDAAGDGGRAPRGAGVPMEARGAVRAGRGRGAGAPRADGPAGRRRTTARAGDRGERQPRGSPGAGGAQAAGPGGPDGAGRDPEDRVRDYGDGARLPEHHHDAAEAASRGGRSAQGPTRGSPQGDRGHGSA